jgi:crotonobetaine/carnitine-CoA ligase
MRETGGVPALLRQAVQRRGHSNYCTGVAGPLSFAQLRQQALNAAAWLDTRGVRSGDRVAVVAGNGTPGHLALIFGLTLIRAAWVPVSTRLRGDSLRHLLTDADPTLVLVDEASAPAVQAVEVFAEELAPAAWPAGDEPAADGSPDDVLALIYTSGTTGPPKGVQLTERMWLAAARGAQRAAVCESGDRLLVWEPWCHIGGAQVLLLPLLGDVALAILERFSARTFWADAARLRATHMHHLGGIAQILLRQPPSDLDRTHGVRVSWGGGIDEATWLELERRFGVRVHECYGLTETSSICTVNTEGPGAGVGRPLPEFSIRVVAPDGSLLSAGSTGRIQVSDSGAGLLTPGYFRQPEATAAARSGEWWDTGDLGRLDPDGTLHFRGRASDSVRRRGENVSAQWVERALLAHPAVVEAAVIAVPSELADEEILAYLVVDEPVDADALLAHCQHRLADFEVPRFVRFVHALPKTPSQRVAKGSLDRSTDGCLDLEAHRATVDRS